MHAQRKQKGSPNWHITPSHYSGMEPALATLLARQVRARVKPLVPSGPFGIINASCPFLITVETFGMSCAGALPHSTRFGASFAGTKHLADPSKWKGLKPRSKPQSPVGCMVGVIGTDIGDIGESHGDACG